MTNWVLNPKMFQKIASCSMDVPEIDELNCRVLSFLTPSDCAVPLGINETTIYYLSEDCENNIIDTTDIIQPDDFVAVGSMMPYTCEKTNTSILKRDDFMIYPEIMKALLRPPFINRDMDKPCKNCLNIIKKHKRGEIPNGNTCICTRCSKEHHF